MEIVKGKYTLRPFMPGDESGILNLWRTAFKAEMAPALFKWKYLDNPYGRSMMLCVAEKNEIVTFYGGIPFKFQYNRHGRSMVSASSKRSKVLTENGSKTWSKAQPDHLMPNGLQDFNIEESIHVVHLMDIMSHPDHRESRIFAKTARHFMDYYCSPDKLKLMYGFPGEFHYSIGERILNYRKISRAAYFTACSRDLKEMKKSRVLHDQKKTLPGDSCITMEPVENMDHMDNTAHSFDELWESCKEDYPFSIVRDSDFLKWRYFQHPEKEYRVFRFVNARDNSTSLSGTAGTAGTVCTSETTSTTRVTGTTRAYAVFSMKQNKLTMVDLLLPDSPPLFLEVMDCIADYMMETGVRDIETWLPENHFLAGHALTSGFKRKNEPVGIIPTVALFEHSPSLEWIKSNFYFNMGDGDLL